MGAMPQPARGPRPARAPGSQARCTHRRPTQSTGRSARAARQPACRPVARGRITVGPDDLQVPATKEQVKSAPNIEQHGEEVSQAESVGALPPSRTQQTPPSNTERGRRLARRRTSRRHNRLRTGALVSSTTALGSDLPSHGAEWPWAGLCRDHKSGGPEARPARVLFDRGCSSPGRHRRHCRNGRWNRPRGRARPFRAGRAGADLGLPFLFARVRQSSAAVTCQGSATVESGDHGSPKGTCRGGRQAPCQIAKATSG